MPITPSEALNKIFDARVKDARVRYARTISNLINLNRIRTIQKTSLDWDVRFSGTTSKREAVTANVTKDNGSNTVPANLRIGRYRLSHTFEISKIAISEAQAAAPEDIKDLFGTTLDDALSILFRDLNELVWNGTGTAGDAEVIGLMQALDNTKTYAGIDPTLYPEWQAITLTNGSARPFTRSLMLAMDEKLDVMEEDFDLVYMNPTMLTTYKTLFDTLGAAASLPNSRAEMTLPNADLGHGGAMYNGRPIYTDPKVPNGNIVLLDSSEIEVYIFDAATESEQSPSIGSEVINRSYGVPFRITQIPGQNPDALTFNIRIHPQVKVGNRKSLKAIQNLTN